MEQSEIKLFEGKNIRYVWDEEKEQYFFSVVDVIQVLGYRTAFRLLDIGRRSAYWIMDGFAYGILDGFAYWTPFGPRGKYEL